VNAGLRPAQIAFYASFCQPAAGVTIYRFNNMKQKTLFLSASLTAAFFFFSAKNVSASISGFVWSDLNTNGIQDAGEPGIPAVWVRLLDAGGNQVDAQLTDGAGNYNFTNPQPGDYILHFANPGGLWQTLQDQGNNDAVDSDADPLGHTAKFTLGAGQSLDFDAGFTTVPQGCFTPVTITVSAVQCNDNGTADPNDDTFTFAITATGGTGPWGWDLLPDIMMIPYGTPYTFGPYQIVNGAITLTIHDHDNPDCTATVTVNPPAPCSSPNPPGTVCDEKVIACMKYELLGISLDAAKNRTYSIRVTNNCTNKMIYTAFGLPDGVVALDPPNNSVYTAPSGREYDVRNPNFSPFYSIRFKSKLDSISNGQSDVFSYTLPQQSAPDYIHVVTRVYPKIFYEAYLNTFDCVPVFGPKPAASVQTAQETAFAEEMEKVRFKTSGQSVSTENLFVYPNPTEGILYADLSAWAGQTVNVSVLNGQGQRVFAASAAAGDEPYSIDMAGHLPNGLYFLEVTPAESERQVRKFVLQR